MLRKIAVNVSFAGGVAICEMGWRLRWSKVNRPRYTGKPFAVGISPYRQSFSNYQLLQCADKRVSANTRVRNPETDFKYQIKFSVGTAEYAPDLHPLITAPFAVADRADRADGAGILTNVGKKAEHPRCV